ncbi:MAG: CsgG/HfaB family protein [Desulfobacterales bacterium]
MVNKKSALFISSLFFVVILMTACSVGFEHGSTWRSYAAQGWIKVDTTDVNAEYSGYKRLLNEMAFDKGVGFLVNSKGNPDYLYVPSHNVLYLAYTKLGAIYHFPNISAFGSSPIANQYSSMEDSLPYNILQEFQKYDSVYSKQLNIPEPKEHYIDKSYKKSENQKLTKNEQRVKTVDNYVAIFDFEVRDKDKDISRPLTDKVVHVFSESNKYEVIDRGNMNKILGEQKFQMSGCVAQECKVEAGQILGVGKIVNGSVGLVGKTYYLTLQLIDVKSGKVELSAEDECKCEIDELLDSSKRLAKKLLDGKIAQQQ